jgi:NADH-quinone oxidoreductase subunit L
MAINMDQMLVYLAIGIPILGALASLALNSDKARRIFAVIVGFITAADVIALYPSVSGAGPGAGITVGIPWLESLGISSNLYVDQISFIFAFIATFLGAFILMFSMEYMSHETSTRRYYFLMLLFIGGMVGVVFSDSLLLMYLFWEIIGICSYALIGYWYQDRDNAEAGMKSFMVTRSGDMGFLLGLLVIFYYTHTFSIQTLIAQGNQWATLIPVAIVAYVPFMLLLGAMGKSAQFPFHVWLPDAMAGPTTVSALIHAATLVNAGVYMVARTMPIFASTGSVGYFTAVALIGAFTAFMAATMALSAIELKKVLAYSTLSQIGYMFMALGVAGLMADHDVGLFAAMSHLLSHAIFKALLFLDAGVILHIFGTKYMTKMGGMKWAVPIVFWTFVVGALSLSGVPPLAGFFSKETLLDTILEAELGNLGLMLYAVGVGTAIITVFYIFRALGMTFFGNKRETQKIQMVLSAPLMILALVTIVLGFGMGVLWDFFGFIGVPVALGPVSILVSLGVLALGGIPAYQIYIAGKWKLNTGSGIARKLNKFPFNRCIYLTTRPRRCFHTQACTLCVLVLPLCEFLLAEQHN